MKRFQSRHGLVKSAVNAPTIAAMNVPADYRLRQLETNIVRLRSFSANLGERFVTANIPAAMVETVENDTVATHHAAGVGKIDRQSPVMQTRALDIDFNPYWTVPASIIRKDLIPDAGGRELPVRSPHSHFQQGKCRSSVEPDRLAYAGRDQLSVPRGSGHRKFARRRAHQHQQSLWRLYARHAGKRRVRRRFPLCVLGLHAPAERA